MLRELTREQKSNCSLDLAGRQCLLLVVSNELDGLLGNSVKDIVDEGVHDTHGLLADSSVGVDLLQHLEDVDTEMFSSLSASGGLLKTHACKEIGIVLHIRLHCGGSFLWSSFLP